MSNLDKQHNASTHGTKTNNSVINLDDNIIDENSIIVLNLPESEDFVSDVNVLMWTGQTKQTTNKM